MSQDIANMKDSSFFDKNFNGLSDEMFDDVIKFFDFPLEDVETNNVEEDWDAQFKHLEEPSLGVFSLSSSGLCGKTQNENPKYGRTYPASVNGNSPVKQVANTAEPIYGKTVPNQNVFNGKDLHQFRTYSPVSVFESSSSSVENSNFDLPVIPVKHARGKRQRLSNFSLLLSIPFISTSRTFQTNQGTAVSDSDLGTHLGGKLLNTVKKKPREKDLSLPSGHIEKKRSTARDSAAPRKCMHCEVTTTPQWREGPIGPKTLCNACGVRYRSGRLFPEYRPAASPTFVPSLHSNCHKKVIEMRSRAAQETVSGSIFSRSSNLPGNSIG